MVKVVSVVISMFAATLLIAGCAAHPGSTVVIYDSKNENHTVPPLATVDTPGLYVLFPGNGITELDSVNLNKGDKFGFQSRDGVVVGVYIKDGEAKYVNLDGVLTVDYVWKYQAEKK